MNQNGFESDEQEAYYLELERQRQTEQEQQDQYQELLSQLEDIANLLGIDHAISFLEHLKD